MSSFSTHIVTVIAATISLSGPAPASAQTLTKPEAARQIASMPTDSDRHEAIIDGNNIRTLIWDHGSIGQPGREPSLEWPKFSGHGYAYEFGMLVGAEVINSAGDTLFIISDGLRDGGSGGNSAEYDPETGARWQWEPLPGYAADSSQSMALSDDPATWPSTWSAWPGLNGDGVVSADLESYWVMDDRHNVEFDYYPDSTNSSIRGIGIQVSGRSYQWNDTLASDILIIHYAITNSGHYPLNKLVMGYIGDPHIGGSSDFSDDWAGFIDSSGSINGGASSLARNLVYGYDADNLGGWGGETGWLGFHLLELTPSDQWASFSAPTYGSIRIEYDLDIWRRLIPGTVPDIAQNSDNIFLLGTDYFSLAPGETRAFAVAILLANNFEDLIWASIVSDTLLHNRLLGSGSPTAVISNRLTQIPMRFTLLQNYPNPFNPSTRISYELPAAGNVIIHVHDMLGRRVITLADGHHTAGYHETVWTGIDHNGKAVASGVYLYQLLWEGQLVETRKMVLLR